MTELENRYLSVKRALFDRYYNALNEEQRRAVYHINGPLLILAGAGSGKTTVLVHRIAYILRFGNAYHSDYVPFDLDAAHVDALEKTARSSIDREELEAILSEFTNSPCPPWRILAITFTNKAAGEIKARLAGAFPDDPDITGNIWAGTFHSICMRILRRYTELAGLRPGFSVYDADDSKKAIQAILKEMDIGDAVLSAKSAQNYISRAKDRMITPEEYMLEFGNDARQKTVAAVYDAYQKRLAASNALDFDDIICRTVKLLEENKEILQSYQSQFRYVSVDEYQDTNEAQFRLTALLSGGWRNLMVVGDDDQSIYKFRGATIANILGFDRVFSDAGVIRLEQNYRSTQSILDAANAIISHNEGRKGKTLWTDRGKGSKIHLLNPDNQNTEARTIIDTVIRKVSKEGMHYRDFAVLYRTNAQSNALEMAFTRSGIPYRMLGGVRFTDRKEIRDLVAYLQLINNHEDQDRLLRIVNEPRRKIGDKTLAAVAEIAAFEGVCMFDVMSRADAYVALARSASTLIGFTKLINDLTDLSGVMALDDFVKEVLERTGYRQMIKDMGPEEADRLDNLDEFISNVVEYQNETDTPTLVEFLEETALIADVDRYDESADAVVLMTIHSAKGLEFPQVFLPGFEEGIFPGLQTVLGGQAEIEEERRLAYVAVTRAKDELYILHTKSRMLYGRTSPNPPSRFLAEIPEELLELPKPAPGTAAYAQGAARQNAAQRSYGGLRTASADRITVGPTRSADTASVPVFAVGDRVRHVLFGDGDILSAQKMGTDCLYEIAFDTKGTKKLMGKYAKLKKI
ncbi:MAG: UvrD-helicase domain-containing protein [Clostridia bacterium]|nr:UvrD-helicase domain-containing protein [Clostridia bacterium]